MAFNPLPPQAYTKEILQKAYAWLLTQNSSVKDMAHDQNILVSLYLKAQRNGEASLEAPSIQNFKQELKSLAHMIGDFQGLQSAPQQAQAPAYPQTQAQAQPQLQNSVTVQPQLQIPQPSTVQTTLTQPAQTLAQSNQLIDLQTILDKKSLESIQQIKQTLNIGSDIEALRALISIGIKQFKKFDF